MLSNGFATPLHLKRKPSRLLASYLLLVHLLALLALIQALAVPPLLRLTAFGLVLLSVVYQSRRYRRQQDVASGYWICYADGSWRYSGEEANYVLRAAGCVNTPWFVVLTFSGAGGEQRRLLLLCDQIDADSFRRLRVRLKFYQEEASARRAAPL